MFKKVVSILTVALVLTAVFGVNRAYASTLFTPYTGLSVTPGETINYTVDVINNESGIQNLTFDIEGLPKEWSYTITSGGNDIKQLSVKGNSEQQINLDVTIPLEVKKADYKFRLIATDDDGSSSELPFLTTVTEEGTFKTELITEQPNIEGHSGSTFSYSATLKNRTAEKQNYALSSGAPEGWGVQFKADGKNVTSVTLEPNGTADITIDVTPPEKIKAETFEIPIKASAGSTSAETVLEAVITGTYKVEITTPTGNLSTDITSGKDKVVDLVIKNTGTATLTNVEISASAPPKWETAFDTSKISKIKPGKSKTVKATITAPDEAIAGDYVTTFSASAAETSSDADFRVSVKTSTIWGIVGIVIILGVLSGLYYLFRKYGRR